MTIREQLEKEMDQEEIDEIKDKTTKDGILRLLRESGVPEEKLNEVYNTLFEKVKNKISKEEMKEYGIEQYIIIPQVYSRWSRTLKHFNNHVWPGTDSILITYLEDRQAKEIMRLIKIMKIDLGKSISMGAAMLPVDDIIL